MAESKFSGPEAIEHFSSLREKWRAIGLSTSAVDKRAVQSSVHRMYSELNLPIPRIIWCDSPWQVKILYGLLLYAFHQPEFGQILCQADFHSVAPPWVAALSKLKAAFGAYSAGRYPAEKQQGGVNKSLRPSNESLQAFDMFELDQKIRELVEQDMPAKILSMSTRRQFRENASLQISEHIRTFSSGLGQTLSAVLSIAQLGRLQALLHPYDISIPLNLEDLIGIQIWRRAMVGTAGVWWGAWSRSVDPALVECEIDLAGKVKNAGLWIELAAGAPAYLFCNDYCFVSQRPTLLSFNEGGLLHAPTGPAIKFQDGYSLYSWRGLTVENSALRSNSLTVQNIHDESNIEIRRSLIEFYGVSQYLMDSGASVLDQDEYGTLYCQAQRGDDPIVMLKVTNRTPEPDGSFKEYFLRVPPEVETAREAVAWTFGMEENEYNPDVQT